MHKRLARAVLLVCAAVLAARFASAQARLAEPAVEINALLSAVGRSDCSFIRNGQAYSGAEAREHLARKYRYLRERQAIASAEAFVEHVGSGSSISGKPYEVQCPGAQREPSAQWLRRVLSGFRQSGRP